MAHHDVDLTVEAARAVIAAPHLHADKGLRRSIEVLKTYGDWMDFERAKHLERQLDAEATDPTPSEIVEDAIGAVVFFIAPLVGLWLGFGFGWQ